MAETKPNLKRYSFLFAAQTLGMAVVLYVGLPFYRQLLLLPTDYPGTRVSMPAVVAAVVVMQVCFWSNRSDAAEIRGKQRLLLRYVIQFLSRLIFGFAGAMFVLVFYQRIHDFSFTPVGIAGLLFILFSVYCYSVELDSLSDAFK